MDFIISSLGYAYMGQSIKKCTSSSTTVGQKGQNLSSLGVLGVVCLSFSMFKRLLDSLNFVSACLDAMFLISSRHFSHPISVLISAYVRSLLSGWAIAWKVSLWNFSHCFLCSILWIYGYFVLRIWASGIFSKLYDCRVHLTFVIHGSSSVTASL